MPDDPQDRCSALLHMITAYLDSNMSWRDIATLEPFQSAGIHYASLNQWYRGERELTTRQRRILGMTTPVLQYNSGSLSPSLYPALEAHRQRLDITKAAYTRRALMNYLENS